MFTSFSFLAWPINTRITEDVLFNPTPPPRLLGTFLINPKAPELGTTGSPFIAPHGGCVGWPRKTPAAFIYLDSGSIVLLENNHFGSLI